MGRGPVGEGWPSVHAVWAGCRGAGQWPIAPDSPTSVSGLPGQAGHGAPFNPGITPGRVAEEAVNPAPVGFMHAGRAGTGDQSS